MEYAAFSIVLIICLALFIRFSVRKNIPHHTKKRIQLLATHVETLSDPSAMVLEADKVLHEALKALGKQGTMGDLLKRYGSQLPNEQSVWNAHKLRNRIAHEPMVTLSQHDAETAKKALLKAARSLL